MSYMYSDDIKGYLKQENMDTMIHICKEIYVWKFISGQLPVNSKLEKLGEKMNYSNLSHIAEVILIYMNEQLAPVVSMMLGEFPTYYFRTFKETLRKENKDV